VIFDVGMHDGTDTASYLSRGYAVLAIEADPSLASAGVERFDDAISRGQLQARQTYLRLRDRFFANTEAKTYAFWYDWHATY